MSQLVVSGVGFSYRRRPHLFDALSITFDPGKTVLLGPNGAGKSTLLSLCASVIESRSGTIALRSASSTISATQRRAFRSRVAWLPQRFQPVHGLTVGEHVAYTAWLKGLSRSEASRGVERALRTVQLQDLREESVARLSGGQLQRLGIAGALSHDAEVILLDEPSVGLDPLQRETLQQVVAELDEHRIVVVSTHQTEDIVGTFDSVVVMSAGSVLFQGSLDDFTARSGRSDADQRDQISAAYRRFVERER